MLNLLVSRANPSSSTDDMATRRLVKVLVTLDVDPALEGELRWSVFELGADVGRHVYAKLIVEDSLPDAVSILSDRLELAGLAGIQLERAFHRTARIRYRPKADGELADPRVLEAYLGGVVHGTLSEAMNCTVEIEPLDGHRFSVCLGNGRDVNVEVG